MATFSHTSLIRASVSALIILTVVGGCDTGPADSLYDPDRDFLPDPVISSVDPPTALAGIGTITIAGENFSPVSTDNLVFFDDVRGTIVEASPTQLVVSNPNLPKADIQLRVSVIGAEQMSNTFAITLEPAVEPFGDIADFEEVFGIATDDAGNVYMSLFSSNVSVGIKQISPEGERTDYASSPFKWDALGLDDAGNLYGVRNVRAVFRFPPGGGDAETWAVADDRSARFRSLDVDSDGNVWVGGSGGNVYRINPAGELTAFPTVPTVNALTVGAGYVYIVEDGDPADRLVRHAIASDGSLGSAEEIISAPAGVNVLSLALTADGDLFVGTDAPDPIFVVSVDGASAPLYPGLLSPSALSMAWGQDPTLYMVRGRTGTTLPGLIRINTQRGGAD